MATLEQTVSRLNFRLPVELKEKIERAAIVSGVTVTDFAISVLANSAADVLEKHQNRILSDRDRDIFLAMLDSDGEPNDELKKLAQEYKNRVISK
jgi:uncharacterized protein (DUF1778 family)